MFIFSVIIIISVIAVFYISALNNIFIFIYCGMVCLVKVSF